MVERQIVLDTIRKMLSAGLEESVIIDTLKDVGLSEKEIPGFLGEAKGKSPNAQPLTRTNSTIEEPTMPPDFGQSTTENTVHQENALLHTTTHAALESSASQLDAVVQKLDALQTSLKNISSLPISDLNSKMAGFEKRVTGLASEMTEVRAQTQALREVLEKVLDTNRSILQELENKK